MLKEVKENKTCDFPLKDCILLFKNVWLQPHLEGLGHFKLFTMLTLLCFCYHTIFYFYSFVINNTMYTKTITKVPGRLLEQNNKKQGYIGDLSLQTTAQLKELLERQLKLLANK